MTYEEMATDDLHFLRSHSLSGPGHLATHPLAVAFANARRYFYSISGRFAQQTQQNRSVVDECEQACVRESRMRIIKEHPVRDCWSARISETGAAPGYGNSPYATFCLSSQVYA